MSRLKNTKRCRERKRSSHVPFSDRSYNSSVEHIKYQIYKHLDAVKKIYTISKYCNCNTTSKRLVYVCETWCFVIQEVREHILDIRCEEDKGVQKVINAINRPF